jgi:hypothetical protein
VSTGGLMPWISSRSSVIDVAASTRASRITAFARRGSVSISFSAVARESPSETRRACAPSCRSRSIRRISAACATVVSARWAVSSRTRSAITIAGEGRRKRAATGASGRQAYGAAATAATRPRAPARRGTGPGRPRPRTTRAKAAGGRAATTPAVNGAIPMNRRSRQLAGSFHRILRFWSIRASRRVRS